MKSKKLKKILIICALLLTFLLSGCAKLPGATGNNIDESPSADESGYKQTIQELSRNGINLHLECVKSNSIEAKDNILLVHGLTYSSHEFDVNYMDYSLVHFLCDNGYAVWLLDIAGYGQSDAVSDGFMPNSKYASEDVQAAIEKIIQVTNAQTIDMLGWSWGTVISSLAENNCSEYIDKFILYAPILSGIGAQDISEPFHENTWDNAASDFQMKEDGSIDYGITDRAVVDTYCSDCWKYDKSSSPNGGRVDLCVEKSVTLIDLSKITSPTLVICGDKDPYLNMELINSSTNYLPEGSKLSVISGASHCMMLERPYYHDFQQTILNFLSK